MVSLLSFMPLACRAWSTSAKSCSPSLFALSEPVLHKVNPQHAFQANRWTAIAALRRMRLDDRAQFGTRMIVSIVSRKSSRRVRLRFISGGPASLRVPRDRGSAQSIFVTSSPPRSRRISILNHLLSHTPLSFLYLYLSASLHRDAGTTSSLASTAKSAVVVQLPLASVERLIRIDTVLARKHRNRSAEKRQAHRTP